MISVAPRIHSGARRDKLLIPVQEKGVKPERQRKVNKKEAFFLRRSFPSILCESKFSPLFLPSLRYFLKLWLTSFSLPFIHRFHERSQSSDLQGHSLAGVHPPQPRPYLRKQSAGNSSAFLWQLVCIGSLSWPFQGELRAPPLLPPGVSANRALSSLPSAQLLPGLACGARVGQFFNLLLHRRDRLLCDQLFRHQTHDTRTRLLGVRTRKLHFSWRMKACGREIRRVNNLKFTNKTKSLVKISF